MNPRPPAASTGHSSRPRWTTWNVRGPYWGCSSSAYSPSPVSRTFFIADEVVSYPRSVCIGYDSGGCYLYRCAIQWWVYWHILVCTDTYVSHWWNHINTVFFSTDYDMNRLVCKYRSTSRPYRWKSLQYACSCSQGTWSWLRYKARRRSFVDWRCNGNIKQGSVLFI